MELLSNDLVPFGAGDTLGKANACIEAARAAMSVLEPGGTRHKLYEMQSLVAENLPPVDCPLQHVFAPGAVARTIFIPAGTVIVGKIHKHKHLNILSSGRVTVVTESAGRETLEGPLTMVSEPGTKRAVYAHTDVVWTTIHLTNKTDLAEIEAEVIAKDYQEYEQFCAQQKMLAQEVAL